MYEIGIKVDSNFRGNGRLISNGNGYYFLHIFGRHHYSTLKLCNSCYCNAIQPTLKYSLVAYLSNQRKYPVQVKKNKYLKNSLKHISVWPESNHNCYISVRIDWISSKVFRTRFVIWVDEHKQSSFGLKC